MLSVSLRRLTLLLFPLLSLIACTTPDIDNDAATSASSSKPTIGDDRVFPLPYLLEELDNGLTVLIVKTDYPDIVNLQIPVQTGSRNEIEPGKSGFAHFFEHMMFRGTENFPPDMYNNILKNAGADQNAYTTDDYTNYHITFTKDDLEKILEIEADRFQNLIYTEDQFRTEAQAVKGEYLKNSSNPISKLLEVIRAASFKEHTYGHTTMGFLADIEDMPNQMNYSKIFFDRWYRPEKSAVIITGDVEPKAALKLVKRYFGEWQRGDYNAPIPQEPPPSGPLYEHIAWETDTQPWLVMAFRGPRFDPDQKNMPAMDVFSSIYLSQSSDLYKKIVVEERWADALFPSFPDRKDPNLLLIGARLTDSAYAGKVRDAIAQQLASARTQPVNSQRLEETKSRLRYQFAGGMDNSEAIGDMLASYMQFDNDPETVNRVYRQYAQITAQDLLTYANQYFNDKGMITATLAKSPTMPGFTIEHSIDALVTTNNAAQSASANASSDSLTARVKAWQPSGKAKQDNQARYLAMPSSTSPLVDLALVFDTGAADDPVGKKGLAMLTAAMLTDAGSAAFSYDEINKAMYPIAASFSAQVDKEMLTLRGSVHQDNIDTWYNLVRSRLLEPGWSEEDFNRIRTRAINAVRTDLVSNNDEELGKELLYQRIFGANHPYGSFNGGHSDDLNAITLNDVKAFYQKHLNTHKLRVGVSGGYPATFLATLKEDLGRLPAYVPSRAADNFRSVTADGGRQAIIVEKESQAVAVSFGFPITVKRGDPDWVALWLARSWLGEHRSFNSHLFARIREERGMNYGDYAYIEYFPNGMFQFHPDANLARQQQIFQVWVRPLRSNNDAMFASRVAMFELQNMIDNGMTQTDFDTTRNYLQKFVSLLVKSQSRQLGYALDSDFYNTESFTQYVRDGLANLTLEKVNKAISTHLQSDNMQFVFVTKDATGLRQALLSDQASPIRYNTPKPNLAAEDAVIETIPFNFERVDIIAGDDVFK